MNNLNLSLMIADLKNARLYLLRLHKALLDYEKGRYESQHGRVKTAGEYYNLVVNHNQFAWLRAMSQLIVEIDEAIDAKLVPLDEETVVALARQATQMITINEASEFSQRYDAALQKSPDAMFEHIKLTKELAKFNNEV